VRGAGLLRHAERYLRQTGSGDDKIDLLARVAALDGLLEGELTRMARCLDCAEHKVTGWLQHSTTNGVVELAGGVWRVRPQRLPQALVGRWFFGVPRRAAFESLLGDWPDRELPLLRSAVAAALLGANAARVFADRHVPSFIEGRPRNVHPSHAFRLLDDLRQRRLPEGDTDVGDREAVLEAAIRSLEHRGSDAHADIAAKVAGLVFTPEGSGTWPDPVKWDVLVMSNWVERPAHLQRIAEELWPRWRPLLGRLSDHGVKAVLDAISGWFRIDAKVKVSDEIREIASGYGQRMLLDARGRAAGSPGLAVLWNRLASRARLPDHSEVDPHFDALVADPWGRHRSESQVGHLEHARVVAQQLAAAGPHDAFRQLLEWQRQAELLYAESSLWLVVRELALIVHDPTEWAVRMLELSASIDPRALIQMFDQALTRDPRSAMRWLRPAMADPRSRQAALTVALRQDAPGDLTEFVLRHLGEHDTSLIERAIWRRSQADEMLHALLTHPLAAIRGQAALSVKAVERDDQLSLPPEWSSVWSEAFLEVTADDHYSDRAYLLGEILGELATSDPDRATAWFSRHLRDPGAYMFECIERVADLPRTHRGSLLHEPGLSRHRRCLVEASLAHDPGWASELLDSGAITLYEALTSIKGECQGPYFETLGPLLLERGATARKVARSLVFGVHFGPESDHYALLMPYRSYFKLSILPAVSSHAPGGAAERRACGAVRRRDDHPVGGRLSVRSTLSRSVTWRRS
jgi:hypothetical protein